MDILMSLLVANVVTVIAVAIYISLDMPYKPTADKIRKEFEPKGYTVTEDEIKW